MSRPSVRKDPRLKCKCCLRWMRFNPTEKTPARRRPAPDASVCTVCKPGVMGFRLTTPRCERQGCNVIDALGEVLNA